MRLLKSFVFTLFFAALVLPAITNRVAGQGGASEAPAAFDNQTNGFTDQTTFHADRAAFEKQEIVGTGLGPVYNAQSCAECHQNPVTGGISQIPELRAGHNDINGRFVDAPGGSLIQSRAIHPKIQERVPDTQGLAVVTTGGIHSINEDGGEQALIRAGIEPEWSPDGSK
ncbi:MAG TPA: hypothetical protein VEQ42_06910, partial [Pyrinomonadaceae bacterium]|nr:hypothetical protein [Pyrinomonadaceae bacterium]